MPKTTTRAVKLHNKKASCGVCGGRLKIHQKNCRRIVKTIGISGPAFMEIRYYKYWCPRCEVHNMSNMDHIVPLGGYYHRRVVLMAVHLCGKHGPYKAGKLMEKKYHVRVPTTTVHGWWVNYELGGFREGFGG